MYCAPKLENRKTSRCSPRALNLLHVLPSRMVGWNKLCNPGQPYSITLFILSNEIYLYLIFSYMFLARLGKAIAFSRAGFLGQWMEIGLMDDGPCTTFIFGASFDLQFLIGRGLYNYMLVFLSQLLNSCIMD